MDCIPFILLLFCTDAGRGVSLNPHVETNPSVTLREGSKAMLLCGYERVAFAVYWYKNVTTSSTSSKELLVYLDLYYNEGKRNGPGLDDGYNVADDFALVINEVRQKDAGMFICEVSDFEEGALYRNHTIVNIQALESMSKGNPSWMAGVIAVCVIIGLFCILLGLVILANKMNVLPTRVSRRIRELPCVKKTPRRREEPGSEYLIDEGNENKRSTLRETIRSYSPGNAAGIELPDEVKKTVPNICLFGQTGDGKSTLINGLKFALTGEYSSTFCETHEEGSSGAGTIYRNKYQIAQTSFNLVDNRGMKDFSPSLINNVVAQVKGERGLDPDKKMRTNEEEECHCPVFVLSAPTYLRHSKEETFKFINNYYDKLKKYYGYSPMIVITHKEKLEESNQLELLKTKLHNINFPTENIWAFENYTKTNCKENIDKDIELLKFLWRALDICDHNIKLIPRRKIEQSGCIIL